MIFQWKGEVISENDERSCTNIAVVVILVLEVSVWSRPEAQSQPICCLKLASVYLPGFYN